MTARGYQSRREHCFFDPENSVVKLSGKIHSERKSTSIPDVILKDKHFHAAVCEENSQRFQHTRLMPLDIDFYHGWITKGTL